MGTTSSTDPCCIPPDPNGAVGAGDIVEIDNTSVQVWTRVSGNTSTLLKRVSTNTLLNTTKALSDPRVFFDNAWNRWVIVVTDATAGPCTPLDFFMAASQTSDPTGSWFVYDITVSGASFPAGLMDYPEVGMDANSVLVTGHDTNCSNHNLVESLVAIPKQRLYNNGPLPSSVPAFLVPQLAHPAFVEGIPQNLDAKTYIVASELVNGNGNGFDLYYMTNTSSPGSQTLVFAGKVKDPLKPKITPGCAPEPGVGPCLGIGNSASELEAPPSQLNGLLWVTRTVSNGTRAAVEYGYINETTRKATMALTNATSTSYDFNSSIAASDLGSGPFVWLNWSSVDPALPQYLSMRVSGLSPGDVPTNLGPYSITTGISAADASAQRYGDFDSVSVDPEVVSPFCPVPGFSALAVDELYDSSGNWYMQDARVGFC